MSLPNVYLAFTYRLLPIYGRVWSTAHPTRLVIYPSGWEGGKASDIEEKGGKTQRRRKRGDRKGVTQTDRKTDRHALV